MLGLSPVTPCSFEGCYESVYDIWIGFYEWFFNPKYKVQETFNINAMVITEILILYSEPKEIIEYLLGELQ